MKSRCVTQARVRWHDHSSLQPQTAGLKWSSCLSLLSTCEYWRAPLCLSIFCNFCSDGLWLCSAGWSQTSSFNWFSCLDFLKCCDYRCEPPCLAFLFFVEIGFACVAQADLKQSSPLSSQVTRITGVIHHAWPHFFFLNKWNRMEIEQN